MKPFTSLPDDVVTELLPFFSFSGPTSFEAAGGSPAWLEAGRALAQGLPEECGLLPAVMVAAASCTNMTQTTQPTPPQLMARDLLRFAFISKRFLGIVMAAAAPWLQPRAATTPC